MGANLQHLWIEGWYSNLRNSSRAEEVAQQRGVRSRQPPKQPGREAGEEAVAGAGGIDLHSGERRHARLSTVPVEPTPVPPLRHYHAAPPPRRLHPDVRRLLRGRLEERHPREEPRVRRGLQRHVADGAAALGLAVEGPDQRLRVHEHRAAEPDHPLERLGEHLPGDADGEAVGEAAVGEVGGVDRVAGMDSPELPVGRVRRGRVVGEARVEGRRGGGAEHGRVPRGRRRGGVGEVVPHLRHHRQRRPRGRRGVEHVGHERRRTPQRLPHHPPAPQQHVVAVAPHHEPLDLIKPRNTSSPLHPPLLLLLHLNHHFIGLGREWHRGGGRGRHGWRRRGRRRSSRRGGVGVAGEEEEEEEERRGATASRGMEVEVGE